MCLFGGLSATPILLRSHDLWRYSSLNPAFTQQGTPLASNNAKISNFQPPAKRYPDEWSEVFDDVEAGVVPPDAVRELRASGGKGKPPNLTKFTPERVAVIFEALHKGYPKSTAAELAGVTRQTVDNWIKKGQAADEKLSDLEEISDEEERYLYFYYGAQQAMAGFEKKALESIKESGFKHGNWQALMTLLERTRPEKYSRRQEVEHSGHSSGEISITLDIGDKPDPEEIEDVDYTMVDDDDEDD